MAQSGNFTPILLYSSSTPGNIPPASNLLNNANGSETGINIADGRLFYKNSSNVVTQIADKNWIGTVTSVAALTLGTTGTDLSSTVANGTTTPVITLNVPTASATNRGALSSTDWSTFNGKQAALVSGTNIKTVGGNTLLGSGDVGTIGVGYGGTGKTSFTANQIIYGSAFSQSSSLTFDGTTLGIGAGSANQGLLLNSIASGTNGGGYITIQNNGSSIIGIGNKSSIIGGAYDATSYLYFPTSLQIGYSSTPVATLFASGGVSIGNTTDPGAGILSVNTKLVVATTTTSLGIVGIGNAGTTLPTIYSINSSAASGGKGYLSDLPSQSNNTNSYHFAGLTQNVGYFYLYGNGTSSWTSDARKKKNIQTTRDGYLEDLMNLRVVKYNWFNQEENEPKELGLIAQEVEQVFPGLVQDALDADVDGVTYKVFKGSVLPYMLLKALQELNDKFEAYVASHP